jgi:hypothetical protein
LSISGDRHRLAVASVLVAAVVSCAGPPAAVRFSVFAFTTPSQLSLVRNGVVAATVAASPEPRYPVFTDSGRFVAAANGAQIVAVGLAANSARVIPSSAEAVFAGGSDTITWWESPNLVSVDLSNPSSAPVRKHIDLPGGTRLISLANGIAVFAQAGELVTMSRDQSFHRLGPAPDKQPISVGFPSPDGRKFAYEVPMRAACPRNAVGVVDTSTNALTSPPMPYSVDKKATTRAIWWDKDGLLHISIAEKPCGTSDDTVASMTTWKLDGGNWIQADPGPTMVSRQLDNNAVALVTPPGTLWIVTDGHRDQIADTVTGLAAPLFSQA